MILKNQRDCLPKSSGQIEAFNNLVASASLLMGSGILKDFLLKNILSPPTNLRYPSLLLLIHQQGHVLLFKL